MKYILKFCFWALVCSMTAVVTNTVAWWFLWGIATVALTVLPMTAVLEGVIDAIEDMEWDDYDMDFD